MGRAGPGMSSMYIHSQRAQPPQAEAAVFLMFFLSSSDER
ncbi:hypothetical protein WCP94_004046 [Bilophila wadsworthia]